MPESPEMHLEPCMREPKVSMSPGVVAEFSGPFPRQDRQDKEGQSLGRGELRGGEKERLLKGAAWLEVQQRLGDWST